MTHNEYNEILRKLRLQKQVEEQRILENLKQRYDLMLTPSTYARIATLNTEGIKKGDIITDGNMTLKVERISLHHCETEEDKSYLEFRGPSYTKKIQPCKNGEWGFIQQRYGTIPTIIKK